MKRFLFVLLACVCVYSATAQTPVTYTHTKSVLSSGEEIEGSYDQLQVVITGNILKLTRYPNLIFLYDHQENGWSIYCRGGYDTWSGRWRIVNRDYWYAVSPDGKTINHHSPGILIGGFSVVYVYKQGTQSKSIGPMYE